MLSFFLGGVILPTSTFYNLPEIKREKLINAIRNEFSKNTFDKISINQIIKEADIPRGSFYQYFNDKDDVLEYILLYHRKNMIENVFFSLEHNNGDIFKVFEDACDFFRMLFSDETNKKLWMNLFTDRNIIQKFIDGKCIEYAGDKIINEFIPHINFDELNITRDEVKPFLEILISIFKDTIMEIFWDITKFADVKAKYIKKISLIKKISNK